MLLVDAGHPYGVAVGFLNHPVGRNWKKICSGKSKAWSPSLNATEVARGTKELRPGIAQGHGDDHGKGTTGHGGTAVYNPHCVGMS